jgi:hypothetical protein
MEEEKKGSQEVDPELEINLNPMLMSQVPAMVHL